MLVHFTCSDCVDLIRADGVLRSAADLHPGRDAGPVGHLIWATDIRSPLRHALGLANMGGRLLCDRTEHRFRVDDESLFTRWITLPRDVRRTHGPIMAAAGARPAHWWVATVPVPVTYDPIERTTP